MKIKLLLSSVLIFFITSSFKEINTKIDQKKAFQNLNISFLLDLSDRIDPKKNPDLYRRDIQHIKSVEKAFINHIKGKKILLLKDQMQIFFDPIPKIANIDNLSKQLRISFNKFTTKKDIENTNKNYSAIPSQIYQHAIKDNHYVGSDIWKFFKNNVHQYCIKQEYRNILVILTDGYMYHKNSIFFEGAKSSYITPAFIKAKKLINSDYKSIIKKNNFGFIPASNNLQNLEIIVLGINPSIQNPYEEDVIKQYWADWFKAMNVKKFHLIRTDLPSSIDPVIQDIIQ